MQNGFVWFWGRMKFQNLNCALKTLSWGRLTESVPHNFSFMIFSQVKKTYQLLKQKVSEKREIYFVIIQAMIPLIFLSQPLNLLLEFVKFLPGVVVVVVLDILVALRFVQLCLYLAELRLREFQFCLNFVLFRVASVQPHLELFHLRKLRSLVFLFQLLSVLKNLLN